jgi:hypothetical protein
MGCALGSSRATHGDFRYWHCCRRSTFFALGKRCAQGIHSDPRYEAGEEEPPDTQHLFVEAIEGQQGTTQTELSFGMALAR